MMKKYFRSVALVAMTCVNLWFGSLLSKYDALSRRQLATIARQNQELDNLRSMLSESTSALEQGNAFLEWEMRDRRQSEVDAAIFGFSAARAGSNNVEFLAYFSRLVGVTNRP